MPSYRASQTVRRRRLGAELRRLRERSDMTGDQAAELLGWSNSKISRIETNRIGVKPADLTKLLDLYGPSDEERQRVQDLFKEPAGAGIIKFRASSLTEELRALLDDEAGAQSEWNWEPQIIPGLLQTEDYARAIHEGFKSIIPTTRDEIERRVKVRLARQEVLIRTPPLQFSAVIDESVLYRQIGAPAVMRNQLLHLIKASEMPNVKLRILPFAGDHPLGTGSFIYLQYPPTPAAPVDDLVKIEQLTRGYESGEESETLQYQLAFKRLEEISLSREDSLTLIRRLLHDKWPEERF
jgi:transcriptional regulator with XRE-family HTH domain